MINALAFALAAVPIYLLARRLLSPWPSVGVSALSIAIPSAMYTSVLMTESVAYLLSCSALLAIALALEKPTVTRQVAALALIGAATLTRPQFVVLYPALVVSLVAVPHLLHRRPAVAAARPKDLADPRGRPRRSGGDRASSADYRRGRPRCVFGPLAWIPTSRCRPIRGLRARKFRALSRRGATRRRTDRRLEPRRPRPGRRRTAGGIRRALPRRQCRLGHDASPRSTASSASTCTTATSSISSRCGSSCSSTGSRTGRHVRGSRRPWASVSRCSSGSCRLSGLGQYKAHWRFHALGSASPTEINQALGSTTATRVVLVAVALVLAVAVLSLTARAWPVAVAAIVCVFFLNGTAAWATAHDPVLRSAYPLGTEDKLWVDHEVPADASVTMLLVSCERAVPTDRWQVTANSISLTEFFNTSVGRVVHVGGRDERTALRVLPDGSAAYDSSGLPVRGAYLVAQSSVPVRGRRVAHGTAEPLVLWRLDRDRLAFAGIRSGRQLQHLVCAAARRSRS